MAITAKVKVYSIAKVSDGQKAISFNADYDDERNKEWAKYTPTLSLSMTVVDEVAAQFDVGQAYGLTFTLE